MSGGPTAISLHPARRQGPLRQAGLTTTYMPNVFADHVPQDAAEAVLRVEVVGLTIPRAHNPGLRPAFVSLFAEGRSIVEGEAIQCA